jgi:hypothetical protein
MLARNDPGGIVNKQRSAGSVMLDKARRGGVSDPSDPLHARSNTLGAVDAEAVQRRRARKDHMQLDQARGSQSLLAFSGPATAAAARTRLDKGHRARSYSRMPMPMLILAFAAPRAAASTRCAPIHTDYLVGRDPERPPSGQLLETRPLCWRSAGHPRHQPSPCFNSRPRPESS